MAKVLVAWCDPCMQHDEHNKAETVLVSLDGQAPKELDLCEVHDKELLGSLRELLAEAGQKPSSPVSIASSPSSRTASGEQKQCPQCPPGKLLTSEGLRGHLRKVHKMERPAANDIVRELFGITRRVTDFSEQCKECAAEGTLLDDDLITYDSPQGLAAHRRSAHGVAGVNSR